MSPPNKDPTHTSILSRITPSSFFISTSTQSLHFALFFLCINNLNNQIPKLSFFLTKIVAHKRKPQIVTSFACLKLNICNSSLLLVGLSISQVLLMAHQDPIQLRWIHLFTHTFLLLRLLLFILLKMRRFLLKIDFLEFISRLLER